jgi:hypothetical protein
MKILKGYVCSMAHLKGSMAEGYVLEETLGFVMNTCMNFNMYLEGLSQHLCIFHDMMNAFEHRHTLLSRHIKST